MTNPFQDGLQDQTLFAQYDTRVGKYQFRPRPLSIYDGHKELEWRELSGFGCVYSYTIIPSPPVNGVPSKPRVLAVIQLDEGIRIFAPLINIPKENIKPGMKVKVCWPENASSGPAFNFQAADQVA